MARPAATLLAVALAAAAAVALSSCGGESDAKLLPGRTADEITANLEAVRQLADEGECVGAEDAALKVSSQVDAVQEVNVKLKQALEAGARKLNEVIGECEEAAETTAEETIPSPAEAAARKDEEREAEQEEKAAEKEEQEGEKEAEKAEKEAEKEQQRQEGEEKAEKAEPPPSLPPQANGEAKGHGEPPSGGVGPSNEVGGD